MSTTASSGARFRAALAAERPLQIAGAIDAYLSRRSSPSEGGRR